MSTKKARRRSAKSEGATEAKTTSPKEARKPPPDVPRSPKAIVICALATLALVGADLYTKHLATENLSTERMGPPIEACEQPGLAGMQHLPDSSYVIIEDYLELRYAENCGAAFGLLDNAPRMVRRGVFGIAGIAATLFLFLLFVRGSGGRLFGWSVPLIVSGAIGNLVDRARLEYVVDFIYFHVKDQFQYPTFNVADITITVGVAFLILDGFIVDREEKQRRKKPETVAAEAETPGGGESPDDDDDAEPPKAAARAARSARASSSESE